MGTLIFGMFLAFRLPIDDPAAQADKPVIVKFEQVPTGHFLVDVKLNDKGPYKLIFDTGAPTMLLNNRAAKDSGILDKKAAPPFLSPFGAMGQYSIKTLQIGDLKAEKIGVTVLDHPTVKAFSDAFSAKYGPIDGIVGFPFFARYRMTVDYREKHLEFVPNGYQPVDLVQKMMAMMLSGQQNKNKPKVLAPSGFFGLTVAEEGSEAGVKVTAVSADSPAADAGVQVGDRLLTLDGRWTDTLGDTFRAAGFAKVGKPLPVVVLRAGKELTLKLTPRLGL